MTPHEIYVAEIMWKRGFTCVDIAESLGYSVHWMHEMIQRMRRKDRSKFPYRHRVWLDRKGRPIREADLDDGDGKVPRRP